MKQIKKAIIPAAGLGTRLLPITKAMPKEMLPILNRPAIDFIIEEAIAAGIEQLLIITSSGKQAIENYYDHHPQLEKRLEEEAQLEMLALLEKSSNIDLHFIRQKEPKGLGHAIWCARHFVGDEPFAVLLADDVIDAAQPAILQMIQQYERTQTPMVAVQHVADASISQYGVIDFQESIDRQFFISNVVEKPAVTEAPSNFAVIGRYILTPHIFEILEEMLACSGEMQLTDAIQQHLTKVPYVGYLVDGTRFDIGNTAGYLKTLLAYAFKEPALKTELEAYWQHLSQHNVDAVRS